MNIRLVLMITAVNFVLNGCALSRFSANDTRQSAAENVSGAIGEDAPMARFAAVDLVNALMQIDGYHPTGEPLRMHQSEEGVGGVLRTVLETAGYQLEIIYGDSPRLIKFYDENRSDQENRISYEIRVGSVRLKRDYRNINGQIKPASYLYVRGASVTRLQLNDQIFDSPLNNNHELSANTTEVKQPEIDKKLIESIKPEDILMQPNTETPVTLWVNGQRDSRFFRRGEELTLTVHSFADVELFCYYRDVNNVVMRLYPNRFSTKSYVNAGSILKIPSVSDWSINAADSTATEEFMCIASDASRQALIDFIQETPDFEPLPVTTFEELLVKLDKASGVQTASARIAIQTK